MKLISNSMIAVVIIWSLLLDSEMAKGQESSIRIPRLESDVTLDGYSDEEAWDNIQPLKMVMYQPVFLGEMTERSEIRMAHDGTHLYISARFFDSDPEGILASSLARDTGSSSDDYLNIGIDPFNDNENILWFYTNPAGMKGDAELSNDGEGDNAYNGSWDTFWSVATKKDSRGWYAEVRIPFSSLGFQTNSDEVTMGIAISRVIARKNERHVYPDIPPNRNFGFIKPSEAQDVTLHNVSIEKPIYITPFGLSGLSSFPKLNNAGDAFHQENDLELDGGFDIKYNLTNNLTLDLTANTDFAQVEADAQQVNLTRFSLFFPEKRQFFQERSGIFNYSLGFTEQLFFSRQIGLHNGEPIPIYGGGRLVGRLGDWDIGILNMQTRESDNLPSENFGVVRLRKNAINSNSYLGGIVTSRTGGNGNTNLVYGLDGIIRIAGNDFLTVKWSQAFDNTINTGSSNQFNFLESGFAQLQWERREFEGFNYLFRAIRWGREYVPGTGFFFRTDFWNAVNRYSYGWYFGEDSRFRSLGVDNFANLTFRKSDNELDSGVWGSSGTLEFKKGSMLTANLTGNFEFPQSTLQFADNAVVDPGRYSFYTAELVFESARGKSYLTKVSVEGGSFYDGNIKKAGINPTWFVSKHLEIGGEYTVRLVRFPERDQRFDSHLARFRINGSLNTKVSANSFVQYNSLDHLMTLNFRFRYNFGERNDLWIVYNEGLNTDPERAFLRPDPPFSTNRTVLIKYTYTFTL